MTSAFTRRDGVLFCEDVDLLDVAASQGTPCYVYSRRAFIEQFKAYQGAFEDAPHAICFSVKANANLAVLNVLAQEGAGFDIVSLGELERALAAGGDPKRIVFSGVAKREDEMARALDVGIKCFNVESIPELDRLNRVAEQKGVKAPISLRVNPDVDAQTHPYISTGLKDNKFGIAIADAVTVYRHAATLPHLEIHGVDCHIGSQLTTLSPFMDALDRLIALVDTLHTHGITLTHIDLGGGLGVDYQGEVPPAPGEYIKAMRQRLSEQDSTRHLEIILEPGRSIAANAGILLTRVEFLKPGETKHFALVDAGMNDMLRPALYQAWHRIERVDLRDDPAVERSTAHYDIVGPVCESSDFLGKDRALSLAPGDLLAVCSAGAYGHTMSSTYNTRPRPPELMVDGQQCHVVRERETLSSLWAGEHKLPG